ncbi:oxysterol-binding protein 1 isoform X1 [Tribolium castaneum]|uniref:Oxysterol-binding protein 1-like Protein n=1 Tax=Tribolium castaneum TaxID=7070 RepID=D6WYT1_TRICA|nr:PREDICTED: oxysterol-binding protein 1 isoform X1 [Tribolium castaneum]EFA08460.1 Oxysterol-binding protein 1-like Protein [Tribolium castaneum]|eukprot:XP_008196115.1 PREDICTED: oxysterol-binding protein 1 isoform X1 [Tribolium castaneum]
MGDVSTTKSTLAQNEPAMKGWLFKWTNYLKGYQRRWFVLQNGHLSYYRAENNGGVPTLSIRRRRRFKGNQAEMAHTCRGSISLHGALIYTVDACTFVISNGGTQTFHIRAASEVERQSWVTALELAKAKAIRSMESEDDEEETDEGSGSPEDWSSVVRKLEAQLNDIQTCSDLIQRHWKSLVKPLTEMETNLDPDSVQAKSKEVSERATLFRISTNAMINACGEYLKTAQTHGHKWIRLLQHEREQRQRLQEMVETLAQQHSKLEQAANAHTNRPTVNPSDGEEEDENEFYDAVADSTAGVSDGHFTLNIPTGTGHRRNSSDSSSEPDETTETKQVVVVTGKSTNQARKVQQSDSHVATISTSKRQRRTRVPDKPHYPLNLWSIMKNCIGKDLSKIPMPVNFSEPLSMLQRLTEDYEYAETLDVAAKCTDPCEQLAYVAAFTISAYSTTSSRTGKPFNPLLGETYECDRRDDLGWRAFNEQVSHHPPMVAQYCEGRDWKCWQEFTMTSKFRGKYLQVIPLGTAQVEFDNGNKFSWRKVTTTIHNIIVGKLWVDQHGDMEIIGKGAAAGIKCHLKYIPYSYFTRDTQRRVKGVVMDVGGNVKWIINGTWDNQVEIAPVTGSTGSSSNPVYETGPSVVAWKRRMPPPDADKYYGFTLLAAQLNEPEEGVAPTDSRLRPDQRLMEEGRWDEANTEKVRLEEKQRAVRRRREAEAEKAAAEGRPFEHYKPIWFEQVTDEDGVVVHVYKGDYWECKDMQTWDRCPDIF